LDLGGLVPLAHPARKTGAQLPAIVPLRSDGADLAAARSLGHRPDVDGGGHPLPQRRDPEVLQGTEAALAETINAIAQIGRPAPAEIVTVAPGSHSSA
jgi:hypothetical protein